MAPGYSKIGTGFDQQNIFQNGKLFLRCSQSFRGTRARSTEGSGSVTLDLTEHENGIVSGYVLNQRGHHSLELCAHQTKGVGT